VISDRLKKLFDDDDLGLLNTPKREKPQTSSDRLEASFLEIVDFYNEHGRTPLADISDMGERKLGVRLRGILSDESKLEALKDLDEHGLLKLEDSPESIEDVLKGDDLGLLDDPTGIRTLKNISQSVKTADYIAKQRPCKDFAAYEPLFREVQKQLHKGEKRLKKFMTEQQIAKGEFFILRGQLVYVAERGADYIKNGKRDARLRVIYENGTESDLLSRALARGLYRGGSRVVGEVDLLADKRENLTEEDAASGFIYVLSSLSNDPKVANISNLYKIGFSVGPVEQRIKNAVTDPTYLMAPVKIVAIYKAYNMRTQKFENLLHRVLANAKLDLSLSDKSGRSYIPAEWFVAPLAVIDEVINLIINGAIVNYYYDKNNEEISLIEPQNSTF